METCAHESHSSSSIHSVDLLASFTVEVPYLHCAMMSILGPSRRTTSSRCATVKK